MRLPKIGWVRMREDLRFEGDIMGVTVSRKGGRWFASFTVDTCLPAPEARPGPDTGIDMGVSTLATLWDGEAVEEIANPKALASALKSLRRLDKAIARSIHTHGKHNRSNRRDILYAKRSRLYADIANLRADHHHKATTQIAKRGGTVKVETLNVEGMKRNRSLSSRHRRRRHGRVRAAAGIQVRLVRDQLRARRPLVPVLEDMQCVRCREAVPAAVGAHLSLQHLRLRVRPGRERRPEHPGVHGSPGAGPNPERAPRAGEVRRRRNGRGGP